MSALASRPDKTEARLRDGIEEGSASRASREHEKNVEDTCDKEDGNRDSKGNVLAMSESCECSDAKPKER